MVRCVTSLNVFLSRIIVMAPTKVFILLTGALFSFGCTSIEPAPTGSLIQNIAPVADAGQSHTIIVGASVTLSAVGSSDSNGDTLTYVWSVVSAPAGYTAALVDAELIESTFTPDLAGLYAIKLVVSDGQLEASALTTVTATATAAGQGDNLPPVAAAGFDKTVTVGQEVSLNGNGSYDNNGDPLTYTWELFDSPASSSAVLIGDDTSTPRLTPDVAGMYGIKLTVSDGVFQASDLIVVTVEASETGTGGSSSGLPIAKAGDDVTNTTLGVIVALDGAASTDDPVRSTARPLSYTWAILSKPAGSLVQLSSHAVFKTNFVPDVLGLYEITLTVTAGGVQSFADTVSVTVDNQRPVAVLGADIYTIKGNVVTLDGSGSSDPDQDSLTYLWSLTDGPTGITVTLNQTNPLKPTFTATTAGAYTFSLYVNDGKIDSFISHIKVFIRDLASNTPPTADAGLDTNAAVGETIALLGAGADADSDTLTYRWAITTKPGGSAAALNYTNQIQTAAEITVDVGGAYTFTLTVDDGTTSTADTVVITVNAIPVAHAGNPLNRLPNVLVQLDGSGSSDADSGDVLTYLWTLDAPPSSSTTLSDTTLVNPSLTPDVVGIYTLTLVVNDGTVDSAPSVIVITVSTTVVNTAPTAAANILGGSATATIPVDTLVVLDGTSSSDPEGDPLSYQWSFIEMPVGASAFLNSYSVVKPWFTVRQGGVYKLRLLVKDGVKSSLPATVLITVTSDIPIADAGPNVAAAIGDQLLLDGSSSYDPNPHEILTYSWSVASAPAASTAVLINPTSKYPMFTPLVAGVYTMDLVVNDGTQNSLVDTVIITVSQPAYLLLLPPAAPASVDGPAVLTLQVTDIDRTPVAIVADLTFDLTLTGTGTGTGGGSFTPIDPVTMTLTTTKQVTIPASGNGTITVDIYHSQAGGSVTVNVTDPASSGLSILGEYLLMDEDFENGAGGFVSSIQHDERSQYCSYNSSSVDDWEHGTAGSSGPLAAHSGSKLWGTNLSGDYRANSSASLEYHGLDLTMMPADVTGSIILSFWHYEDMANDECFQNAGSPSPDSSSDAADDNGAVGWFSVAPNPSTEPRDFGIYDDAPLKLAQGTRSASPNDYDVHIHRVCNDHYDGWTCQRTAWKYAEYDLSHLAGENLDLYWMFINDDGPAPLGGGWFIDDIRVKLLRPSTVQVSFMHGALAQVGFDILPSVQQGFTGMINVQGQDKYGNLVPTDNTTTFDLAAVSTTSNVEFRYRMDTDPAIFGPTALPTTPATALTGITLQNGLATLTLEQLSPLAESIALTASNVLLNGTITASDATVAIQFTGPPQTLCVDDGTGALGTANFVAAATPVVIGTGAVDTAIVKPMRVKVVAGGDCTLDPISHVPVLWNISMGAGTLAQTSTLTSANGESSNSLTLGTILGAVEVTVSVLTAPSLTSAVFTATADIHGAPFKIVFSPIADRALPTGGLHLVHATVQDVYGNMANTDNSTRFTIVTEGSSYLTTVGLATALAAATPNSVAKGLVFAVGTDPQFGAPNSWALVQVENGEVDIGIVGMAGEVVNISAQDSEGTGLLTHSGYYERTLKQDLVCSGARNYWEFNQVPVLAGVDATFRMFGWSDFNHYNEEVYVYGEGSSSSKATMLDSTSSVVPRQFDADCGLSQEHYLPSSAVMEGYASDGVISFETFARNTSSTNTSYQVDCTQCMSDQGVTDSIAVNLTWDSGMGPARFFDNDSCTGALDVTTGVMGLQGDTTNATNLIQLTASTDSACGGNGALGNYSGHDVIYKVHLGTATEDIHIDVRAIDAGFLPQVYLTSGVGCNTTCEAAIVMNNSSQVLTNPALTAGSGDYYIVVDSAGTAGRFEITVLVGDDGV